MPEPFRLIDGGLADGRRQVAQDAALVELHAAGRLPDTVRFLRCPPTVIVGRHQPLRREALPEGLLRPHERAARGLQLGRTRRQKGLNLSPRALQHFRAAVDAAWEELAALQAGGRTEERPELPVRVRLENLASKLPPSLLDRARWSAAITALAPSAAPPNNAMRTPPCG